MAEPKVWDYREPRWGWAVHLIKTPDGGDTWTVATGYGAGLSEGDLVLLAGSADEDHPSTFRLSDLAYSDKPPDMWTAKLTQLEPLERRMPRFDGQG